MRFKDIIIIIIALIFALFLLKISWIIARFLVQTIFVLLVAYIIYVFLKKIL